MKTEYKKRFSFFQQNKSVSEKIIALSGEADIFASGTGISRTVLTKPRQL